MKTVVLVFLVTITGATALRGEAYGKTAYPKVSDLTGESTFGGPMLAKAPHVTLPTKRGTSPGIYVTYSPATKPELKKIRKRYMALRVWERMFAGVNDSLKYKTATTFQMAECGYTGAFQKASERRMVICYEFVLMTKIAFETAGTPLKSIDQAVYHAVVGVAWHEFGHFLLSEFDILVTGSAEDAVDQLSTLIQITRAPDQAAMAVYQGRSLVYLQGKKFLERMRSFAKSKGRPPARAAAKARRMQAYMSKHGSGKRRLHNILCLVYGSNPSKLQKLVGGDGLHPQRAQTCEREFKRVSGAWSRLVKPFTRKPREVSTRRCNDVFSRVHSLMRQAKAPARALAALKAKRSQIVAKCIKDHLAKPMAMGKWVTCVRFARTYQEAMKCPKALGR